MLAAKCVGWLHCKEAKVVVGAVQIVSLFLCESTKDKPLTSFIPLLFKSSGKVRRVNLRFD